MNFQLKKSKKAKNVCQSSSDQTLDSIFKIKQLIDSLYHAYSMNNNQIQDNQEEDEECQEELNTTFNEQSFFNDFQNKLEITTACKQHKEFNANNQQFVKSNFNLPLPTSKVSKKNILSVNDNQILTLRKQKNNNLIKNNFFKAANFNQNVNFEENFQ